MNAYWEFVTSIEKLAMKNINLGEGGGDDDDILGNLGELLDAQVHQTTQHSILGL